MREITKQDHSIDEILRWQCDKKMLLKNKTKNWKNWENCTIIVEPYCSESVSEFNGVFFVMLFQNTSRIKKWHQSTRMNPTKDRSLTESCYYGITLRLTQHLVGECNTLVPLSVSFEGLLWWTFHVLSRYTNSMSSLSQIEAAFLM